MNYDELYKGLSLIFEAIPGRIEKLERYLQSHVEERVYQYLESSMTLSLGKEKNEV